MPRQKIQVHTFHFKLSGFFSTHLTNGPTKVRHGVETIQKVIRTSNSF